MVERELGPGFGAGGRHPFRFAPGRGHGLLRMDCRDAGLGACRYDFAMESGPQAHAHQVGLLLLEHFLVVGVDLRIKAVLFSKGLAGLFL